MRIRNLDFFSDRQYEEYLKDLSEMILFYFSRFFFICLVIDNTRSTWKTCQRRERLPAGEWGLLRKSSLPAFALLIWRMCSVNQCCGSGMFIPDPDFYPSRIPDPKTKTKTKERGGKKFVVITFYVATNFTKLQIILVLKCWRKKFWPIFKEL